MSSGVAAHMYLYDPRIVSVMLGDAGCDKGTNHGLVRLRLCLKQPSIDRLGSSIKFLTT